MSVLFYRRPDYVDRPAGPLNQEDCQKYVERTKNNRNAIPLELAFDKVINDKALPPCSLQDFMDYLVYVAHDAETLQFYLWLKDYTKRYSDLRKEEQTLSPEWKHAAPDAEKRRVKTKRSVSSIDGFDGTAEKSTKNMTRVSTIPGAKELFADSTAAPVTNDYESFITKSVQSQKSVTELADDANAQVGLKWQAFTCQPFRAEITKVIAHYFAPGAPRELNISHRDKSAVLHALQHTTHPSAFNICATIVEATLRGQLHPNFIRWSICNGNKPKIFFVRTMGVSHIALGILIALILTLSSVSRWYRILSAPVTFIGVSTMVAAYKGLCVILHSSGKVRNIKPWEDLDSVFTGAGTYDEEATLALSDAQSFNKSLASKRSTSTKRPRSFDTFGTSNTYADEPWVESYEKKPLMKKVFENNTWVQEETVRLIQDKIVKQSNIWGVLLTTAITVIFVALPPGNLY